MSTKAGELQSHPIETLVHEVAELATHLRRVVAICLLKRRFILVVPRSALKPSP